MLDNAVLTGLFGVNLLLVETNANGWHCAPSGASLLGPQKPVHRIQRPTPCPRSALLRRVSIAQKCISIAGWPEHPKPIVA
jgi:hypothetical protein